MLLCCAILLALGCGEQIEVDNAPAALTIEDVVLHQVDRQRARRPSLSYTLSDLEGDDQYLSFLVCDSQGLACGYPIQARGSDGASFVPTRPNGAPAAHLFLWDAACGRIALGSGELLATSLEDQYTFVASVEGAPPEEAQTSRAFSLKGLGLDVLAPCSR